MPPTTAFPRRSARGWGRSRTRGLLARAAEVLPRVDFIALREGLRGPDLLARLGVPFQQTAVTGEDAIELAYDVRLARLGNDVGVCLRVAEYSPVAAMTKDSVGRAVRGFAAEVGPRSYH